MLTRSAKAPVPAAIVRLASLHPLDAVAGEALAHAVQRPRLTKSRRELLSEGQEIAGALLILDGWAARVRLVEDGRRQIISFLLPGDLIALCDQHRPIASATVIAITDVESCIAPGASVSTTLAQAYAHSRALDEAYLLAQITRLGRFEAHDRIADLLLELLERLERAGLAAGGRYHMPLTQEVIADALGLTSVHVNRMLQALRRDGSIEWKGRDVFLPDPEGLCRSMGRSPTRVTAG